MSPLRGARAVLFAAALVAAAAGFSDGEAPPRRVLRVEFETPVALDRTDLRRHLPLREGEPFDEGRLEESIEWLQQKEIFARIEPEVRSNARGVYVRFHLDPAPFVVGVTVRGASAISEEEILRRARIREDEMLSEVRLRAAAQRLRELYAERGFPDAEVAVESRSLGPGRAQVEIRIREGLPVRLASLAFRGLDPDLEASARAALGFREGDPYRPDFPAQGRETLLRWLRRRSRFDAEVRADVSVEGLQARLYYDVTPGPAFEISLEGNRHFSREELLALDDLAGRPVLTDGTWRLIAHRMRARYGEAGFPFAVVRVEVVPGDPKRVRFEIDEGPRVRVGPIRFDGVRALEPSELERIFADALGGPWLVEEKVEAAVERLVEAYRRHGYPDARVVSVERRYSEDRSEAGLRVVLEEGARVRVAEVRFEGDPPPEIRSATLATRQGQPYDPSAVERDRDALAQRLADLGYGDAQVKAEVVRSAGGDGESWATVHYRIEKGPRVRIRRIIVKNNYFTWDRVIRRELPFRPGDPYVPSQILEAQRRLYRLGLFRSVSLSPVSVAPGLRDLHVRVAERPAGEAQYGFGYNTRSGLRNFLQLSHRNLFGTGRAVSLRGELNQDPSNFLPDEYLTTLDVREPRLLESWFDLRTNLVYQRSQRSIDEFSIRRFSFSTGLEREFAPGIQTSLLLEFEDSRVFDVAPDAVLTGQDVGRLRTVTLNPILVFDGRDDAFAPTRGVFETLRVRYGTPAFGSEVHFAKATAQHSQYFSLAPGWILVYAARVGIAEPLGRSSTIPIRERFFLGGRTSVRGFDENSIGPRGERGNPIGGDFLLNGNGEFRFPLFWGLGGAVFVDGGGLYLRDRGISIREFRESAGPGLRYQTPIGAIRLDYGFKLDRRAGESIGQVHFTIGNLF